MSQILVVNHCEVVGTGSLLVSRYNEKQKTYIQESMDIKRWHLIMPLRERVDYFPKANNYFREIFIQTCFGEVDPVLHDQGDGIIP